MTNLDAYADCGLAVGELFRLEGQVTVPYVTSVSYPCEQTISPGLAAV